MEILETIVNSVNSILWDNVLIYLLVGVGIFYTIRLKFIQVRKFGTALKAFFGGLSLKGDAAGKSGMSSFQAVATAVAGQVGTGNLAGPATAILAGGPGAIFWIWISSFLGMATIYAEAMLAIKFKTVDKQGQAVGGPAYYIEQGLGKKFKWLAVFFAVSIIIALGVIGNMVQSNSIVEAFTGSFPIVPNWLVGGFLAIVTGLVVAGGIKNIASVVEKLVPLMALFYFIGVIVILAMNSSFLMEAFRVIFVAAFNPQAILGAGAGIAVQQAARYGIARGLFSNEAGMGSTPHAHAVAKTESPEQQAYLAMMGVFIVCLIVTLTGFVIITSALRDMGAQGLTLADGNFLTNFYKVTGIAATQQAYQYVFGNFGSYFVSVALFFFAFSTIVGWYYYAETNVRYLFNSMTAVRVFQCFVVAGIFIAAFFKVDLIWNMSDMFNGLMVLPNLVALIFLAPIVVQMSGLHKAHKELKKEEANNDQEASK